MDNILKPLYYACKIPFKVVAYSFLILYVIIALPIVSLFAIVIASDYEDWKEEISDFYHGFMDTFF